MPYQFPKPEPYRLIRVNTRPSRPDLWTLFGTMCAEREYNAKKGQLPVYGDNTPDDVEGCVSNVENGIWKPVLWYMHDLPGGMHWLHDFKGHTTWIGGYVMPGFRGLETFFVRQGIRDHIQSAVHELGYHTVHAGVCTRNSAAIRWAEEVMQSHNAGVMEKWLPVGGTPSDFVIFTWREQDVEQAMVDAAERAMAL